MVHAAQKIVVIGAGMGGLCAAIRLAIAGLSVTLIESQPNAGGKMRSLPSVAGPIDAGPTVLTMRGVFDDLFHAAGEDLADHVTLIPQPLLARHWWLDGSRLDLTTDGAQNTAAIADFAGQKSADEFRAFDAQSAQLYAAFDQPMMLSGRPDLARIALNALGAPAIWPALSRRLGDHLARSFSDPRLRQLFGRYATYVGGAPDLSPAVLGLIWRAEAQGVWAVQGGMHNLARALADLAVRVGVTPHYGVSAHQIIRQNDQVRVVVLSTGQSIAADAVVFNGDPAALLSGLLGKGAQQSLPPSAAYPRSLSAWVWSFAATPAPFDLVHHNVFFASDPAREFPPIAAGKMPQEATLYICAQDRTTGTTTGAMNGPERFEIIMNAPAKTTLSPMEITECRAKTFPQLAKFGLTFDQDPPDQGLMTPQGFSLMFPASQGSIYGRSPQGIMASFQRPRARTALRGLYLAGGGAHPGAGVPMAALSGKHAAEAILKDLTSA